MTYIYQPRLYRRLFNNRDFHFFDVCIGESDLCIGIELAKSASHFNEEIQVKYAAGLVRKLRSELEKYIRSQPLFLTSLEPVEPLTGAPDIAVRMCLAAHIAGVGPMAAVAGAIAETVGRAILDHDKDIAGVIVENGGDIFVKTTRPLKVGISAGGSPLSGKIALEIEPIDTPEGICTSSATVGHSLSLGNADAALIVAGDAFLADAAATTLGNMIRCKDDLSTSVNSIMKIKGIKGALAVMGDKMSAIGQIKLVPVI